MVRRVVVSVLLLLIFANVIAPQLSGAAPFTGQIILGFNERYGPQNSTHWGADVVCDTGSILYAPVSGTVSYVGSVPAAAGPGQKARALTITTALGHQVTLNPFAETSLAKNDTVVKGQALGTLCETGDISSPVPHVHLSLRIEGIYQDPASLIEATLRPSSSGSTPLSVSPSPAQPTPPIPATSPVTGAVPSARPSSSPVYAPQVAPSPDHSVAEGMEASSPLASATIVASVPDPAPDADVQLAPLESTKQVSSLPSASPVVSPFSSPAGSIAQIAGITVIEIEDLTIPATPMNTTDYLGAFSLDRTQWAAILYAVGIMIPLVCFGLVSIAKKLGLSPVLHPQFMHLFAAREEK